jgi:predicted TIM-barrel fold metal-dependent hydrolase
MSGLSAPHGVRAGRPACVPGQLIDVDVHPVLTASLSTVFAYMPRAQREKVAYLGELPLSASPLGYTFLAGRWTVGRNAPPVPAALGPERLRHELLDGLGVDAAQLVATEAASHALQARNYDLAAALASAFNDYMLEQWAVDPRVRYALMVVPADPSAAVAEINRHGADPRVSSVWLPPGECRLGERFYDPVYAAASELGLPILSHPGGPRGALAPAEYRLEARVNAPLQAWANIASLFAHGAFERHPGLTVVFAEAGFAWLPALLARLDAAFPAAEPSAVVRRRVRLTTSPPEDLVDIDDRLADVLVYASDYPRSGPWMGEAFEALPETTRRKLFGENARIALRTGGG